MSVEECFFDRGRIVADGSPDALRERLVGNPTLSVELGGANGAAREALETLPGIAAVSTRGKGCFLLEHRADTDPREAVFRLAVEKGWVLLGLSPEKATLEDVFVRLTTREDQSQAASDAVEVNHA